MLTREQEYAAKIYMQVKSVMQVKGVEAKYQSEYRSMAEKLPVLIRTAGLSHALHFAHSRGEAAKRLVSHLAEVVKRDDILDASRKAKLGDYMRLTQQTLAALQWYKRFAQSLLSDEPTKVSNKKEAGETT